MYKLDVIFAACYTKLGSFREWWLLRYLKKCALNTVSGLKKVTYPFDVKCLEYHITFNNTSANKKFHH